jgi:hypothetical protein
VLDSKAWSIHAINRGERRILPITCDTLHWALNSGIRRLNVRCSLNQLTLRSLEYELQGILEFSGGTDAIVKLWANLEDVIAIRRRELVSEISNTSLFARASGMRDFQLVPTRQMSHESRSTCVRQAKSRCELSFS